MSKLGLLQNSANLLLKMGSGVNSALSTLAAKTDDPLLKLSSKVSGFLGEKIRNKVEKSFSPNTDTSVPKGSPVNLPVAPDMPVSDSSIEDSLKKISQISQLILDKANYIPEVAQGVNKLVRFAELEQTAREDQRYDDLENEAEKGRLKLAPTVMGGGKTQAPKTGIFDSLLSLFTGSNSTISSLIGWDIMKWLAKGSWSIITGVLGSMFRLITGMFKGGKFFPIAGKVLGRLALPLTILNFIYDAFQGVFKSKEWNVNSIIGGIGNLLGGGFNNKLVNMFAQAGSWAVIGATIGSVFPGVGTVVGGVVGGIFGAIAGFFGGERIAKELQNVVDMVADGAVGIWEDIKDTGLSLWTSLRDMFVNTVSKMKIFMYDAAISVLDIPLLRDAPYISDWITSLKAGRDAALTELNNNKTSQAANREALEKRFAETEAGQEARTSARVSRYSSNMNNMSQFSSQESSSVGGDYIVGGLERQSSSQTKNEMKMGLITELKNEGITSPKAIANIMAQADAESNWVPQDEIPSEFASSRDRYKGRGLIQLTGRANYERMTQELQNRGINVDLVANPHLANDPILAKKIAAIYYKTRLTLSQMESIQAVNRATGYNAKTNEGFKAGSGLGKNDIKRARLSMMYQNQLRNGDIAPDLSAVYASDSNRNLLSSPNVVTLPPIIVQNVTPINQTTNNVSGANTDGGQTDIGITTSGPSYGRAMRG